MSVRQNGAARNQTVFSGQSAPPAAGLITRSYARLLARGDIRIDGTRPWDMRVHDRRLFRRLLTDGSLGLGESYVDGWWDAPRLDEFFTHLIGAQLERRMFNLSRIVAIVRSRLLNLQSTQRAGEVGKVHYDIGNELYRAMLGERMIYTCAYWAKAQSLDQAQEHKLELVCRKLGLERGMRLLDIGCGWGGMARYAAERYDVEVVGVTISAAQAELARKCCLGLPVEIRLEDYRALSGRFDRIVSLGMLEHVGQKNYRAYMKIVRRCLHPDGLFLLQTIGLDSGAAGVDPWVTKYIFPNSQVPSLKSIGRASEGLLQLEDLHNFAPDYDRTLMAWHANFLAVWPTLASAYPPGFERLWTYYLLMFAGIFRARGLQLWQLVLAPRQARRVYRRPCC